MMPPLTLPCYLTLLRLLTSLSYGNSAVNTLVTRCDIDSVPRYFHPTVLVGSCQASHIQQAVAIGSSLSRIAWDLRLVRYGLQVFVQSSFEGVHSTASYIPNSRRQCVGRAADHVLVGWLQRVSVPVLVQSC